MNHSKLLSGLGLLVLGTLAASCTVGNEGIFASVEREQKISSAGNLNSSTTINRMAELTGSPDRYLAAGGANLYVRDVASTQWSSIKVGGQNNVTSVGVAGANAYSVAGGGLYISADGVNWVLATALEAGLTAGDAPYDLIPIRKGDGYSVSEYVLVTQTVISGTSSPVLYGYGDVYILKSDGTLSPQIVLKEPFSLSNQTWAVNSAVDDGTSYYLLTDSYLYQVAHNSSSVTPIDVEGVSPKFFGGMIYLDGTGNQPAGSKGFYFTTCSNGSNNAGIYWIPGPTGSGSGTNTGAPFAGATWNTQAIISSVTLSYHPVSFGCLLYNDYNKSLWVGTRESNNQQGNGYAEIVLGPSPSVPKASTSFQPLTDWNNYQSTVLPVTIVYSFFRTKADLYFLGTGGEGLWNWDAPSQIWSQQ